MPTIGIISDTHGLLRQEAIEVLSRVDHIIHAGDIGSPDIIPQLKTICPVSAIRGNIDVDNWALAFPDTLEIVLFELRFFIIHDRKHLVTRRPDGLVDVIISGHSHRAGVEEVDGVVHLYPGSAGPRRFKLPITLATIRIDGTSFEPTIHTVG